jgi:hypothetical protein
MPKRKLESQEGNKETKSSKTNSKEINKKNTHSHLLPLDWNQRQIEEWLREDFPSFDYGGFVVGKEKQIWSLFFFSIIYCFYFC